MDEAFRSYGAIAFGYAVAWLRALKSVPNWASNLLVVVVGILVYWLGTGEQIQTREFWWRAVAWMLVVRGVASLSHDASAAPKTNTL
jgi:hypothetical protein